MDERDLQTSFFEMLHHFYQSNRKRIRTRYRDLTKKFLDYNDKIINENAYLRKPQFEALEMYVFMKEFVDNKSMYELYNDWKKKEGIFENTNYVITGSKQLTLYDTSKIINASEMVKLLEKNNEIYSNYIFALAMGIGKTILMATCIFYEFLLANKYPKDPKYCHNALVFAPDKTVLHSLKEIQTFDKSLVVPIEYINVLNSNIKFHFLEENGVTLNTLDDSDFNIIISNNQKIILKKQHVEPTAATKLFASKSVIDNVLSDIYGDENITEEGELIFNQRFEKITRLSQIGVYVDEAHHLFGASLEKELFEDNGEKTSLRNTINVLAKRLNKKGSKIVGCFNFTGTPYVGKKVLPEVVYSYGLRDAIANKYLKETEVVGYQNVKSIEFLRSVVKDFWYKYGEKRYEGMLPKMAIYCTEIKEAEEIRPELEKILSELDISNNKILINVGDTTITKDSDIMEFNSLDTVKSQKQFIILVGKGKEGWNCRSLFSVVLFRSPKSKIFVLQATMRCLRKITEEQQKATVYLSKENYDILNNELESNFRMDIDAMKSKPKDDKKVSVEVRVVPPPRFIKMKKIMHNYAIIEKRVESAINFCLEAVNMDKYDEIIIVKDGLVSRKVPKKESLIIEKEDIKYSHIMLCSEIARYLNIKPSLASSIIKKSVDGEDKILEMLNKHNDILYDIIIPTIFNYLYDIKIETYSEDKDVLLLKTPDEGLYLFKSDPDLIIGKDNYEVIDNNEKSFHADNYCFDSIPERELFLQYLDSDKVEKVYFTGMFTNGQSEFYIQYIDPETNKLRKYYPDFIAKMKDGHYEIIEVKGDNKIEDDVVKAKQEAAVEVATESKMIYKMYPSSQIMRENVLEPTKVNNYIQMVAEDKENNYE